MKSIEEQIEAAEKEVERCENEVDDAQADLDAAESALEEAEANLAALESEKDAPMRAEKEARKLADVAERTGPQRPVGDRAVRTVCDVSEIPQAYAESMRTCILHGLVGADGGQWASNGHWMVRVESNAGTAAIVAQPESVIGDIGAPLVRDDEPALDGSLHVRTFNGGETRMMLEYNSLVEDLFPGIEWHARPAPLEPIQGLVNGTVVAIVMPMRPPT